LTLILSFMTRDYVALASDRRLTWYEPGGPRHGELITDNRNKTIVLCNHFHIGYTGLANLEGKRTDEWAAERLASTQSAQGAFITLTDEATRAFGPLPSGIRGHAFLAVGWGKNESLGDALVPVLVLISNNLNERWQLLEQTESRFTRRVWTLPPDSEGQLRWVGRGLSSEEAEQHYGYLIGHVQRGSDARGAAFLLANCIRSVARRDSAVGNGVLLSVLSRSAAGQPVSTSLTGSSGPMDEHNCWYLPADDDRNNPVQYSPTYVCQGLLLARGEVWTTKPPWWRD
jgi:hypothetical protein